jgi:hypothetical protein
MARRSLVPLAAALLLATAMVAGPLGSLGTAADMDMPGMITNAKTPADHLALAKMYQDEADKANAQAAAHKKMAEAYMQNPRLNELRAHCKRLTSYYKEAAKEYSLMATIETDEANKPAAQ